jgi:hypothetical protein
MWRHRLGDPSWLRAGEYGHRARLRPRACRGANPTMQDLMSSRIDYLRVIITTAKPHLDGGTVKSDRHPGQSAPPVLPLRPHRTGHAAEQNLQAPAAEHRASVGSTGAPINLADQFRLTVYEAGHLELARRRTLSLAALDKDLALPAAFMSATNRRFARMNQR